MVDRDSYVFVSAVLWAFAGAAWPIFIIVIEAMIGSPSSTSSLAIIAVPPLAVMGGFVGAILGGAYTVGARALNSEGSATAEKVFLALSVVLVVAVYLVPFKSQLDYNEQNRPRVIINEEVLPTDLLELAKNEVDRIQGNETANNQVGRVTSRVGKYIVSHEEGLLTINYFQKGFKRTYDFSGYDYITKVESCVLNLEGSNEEYLLVYTELRATSHHLIYSIFDADGECVYQELKQRSYY